MTNQEFLDEIKRLEINFNKILEYERSAQLYQCLKGIPLWKFRKIIAHIISTREVFRFTVAEFRLAKNEIAEDKITYQEYQCVKCRDTGKIFGSREYVKHCDCQVESEDIRALMILMKYPELLGPIRGESYDEWREYITRPEIVQVLMAGDRA
jgi:hypothetical protein